MEGGGRCNCIKQCPMGLQFPSLASLHRQSDELSESGDRTELVI